MERDRSRIDRYVHLVLLTGTICSISVLTLGLLLYLISPVEVGEGLPMDQMMGGLLAGNPIAIINLGILLLIATPLTRVLAAAVVFTIDKEPRFVAVSLIVIATITLAILTV
ncbi:MAG: DUF1634 domain-containing protein [Euryarchaeota archaeon]|nr:DUF1634 domain-containing protein [Euryarchaeota archaeon]